LKRRAEEAAKEAAEVKAGKEAAESKAKLEQELEYERRKEWEEQKTRTRTRKRQNTERGRRGSIITKPKNLIREHISNDIPKKIQCAPPRNDLKS